VSSPTVSALLLWLLAIMASNRIISMFRRNLEWRRTFSDFRYWSFTLATWIPALIFFNGHVGEVSWISGASMYPYLNTSFNDDLAQDICWTSKWNPTGNLQRGMIVSFQYVVSPSFILNIVLTVRCSSPVHPENLVVKRVIALEGDLVFTRAPCPVPTVQVPVNHLWVEGDNRDTNKTLDSNTYGPIPMSLIQGRITHVLLPWKSFGAIRWWEFRGRTRVIKGRREDAPGWEF
jgi:inner membrane protease subunit 2